LALVQSTNFGGLIPTESCSFSIGENGKLRFGTEYEQHLWSECSRLIAKCIIYYNATLLSQLLAHKENRGDAQGAALAKQASPVA
jgi:hypothetical protein